MDARQRYEFTALMACTDTAVIQTRNGVLQTLRFEANDPQELSIGEYMLRAYPDFKQEWVRYLNQPAPRVHKLLERADQDKDIKVIQMLLAGKRSETDDEDSDLKAFLGYYLSNVQLNWDHICNAIDCIEIASSSCGKCKTARYCSKQCQVLDWRMSHKHSCVPRVYQ
jgi:hypothetical protein